MYDADKAQHHPPAAACPVCPPARRLTSIAARIALASLLHAGFRLAHIFAARYAALRPAQAASQENREESYMSTRGSRQPEFSLRKHASAYLGPPAESRPPSESALSTCAHTQPCHPQLPPTLCCAALQGPLEPCIHPGRLTTMRATAAAAPIPPHLSFSLRPNCPGLGESSIATIASR